MFSGKVVNLSSQKGDIGIILGVSFRETMQLALLSVCQTILYFIIHLLVVKQPTDPTEDALGWLFKVAVSLVET